MIFHENRLPADDSHEITCLICYFWKAGNSKLSSAANYIDGALHVSIWTFLCFRSSHLSLNITISIILNCLYIFTKSFIYECKHLFLFEVISSPGISFNHPLALRMLTLCPLGNFSCFFVGSWFFSKSTFSKNSFRNTIWVSNRLDPDPADVLSGLIWVETVCKSYH